MAMSETIGRSKESSGVQEGMALWWQSRIGTIDKGHLEKLVFCRRPAAMKKPPWRRPGGEKISGARINTPSHACFA